MKELLNGLMLEGYSTVPPSTPYYGHPLIYKYDPDKAKARSRLPAVQVDLGELHLRLGLDAAAANERAGEVADGCRWL
jgi:hypothetical protein